MDLTMPGIFVLPNKRDKENKVCRTFTQVGVYLPNGHIIWK